MRSKGDPQYWIFCLCVVLALTPFAFAGYERACETVADSSLDRCTIPNFGRESAIALLDFLETYEGAVVGLSTLFLAVFTWRLVVTTEKLWKAGDDQMAVARATAAAAEMSAIAADKAVTQAKESSQRQLRAYVSQFATNPPKIGAPGFIATMEIVNSGQTPASFGQVWSRLVAIHVDKVDTFDFTDAPAQLQEPKFSIFPGKSYAHGNETQALAADDVKHVLSDKIRLYWWGEIRYVDAFGEKHRTAFKLYWVFESPAGEGNWRYPEDESNHAT